MKIIKKTSSSGNVFLPLLPTLIYGISKLCGKSFSTEYIWWIIIPGLWVIFLFSKYKLTKG